MSIDLVGIMIGSSGFLVAAAVFLVLRAAP